jgi:hypothetical protein
MGVVRNLCVRAVTNLDSIADITFHQKQYLKKLTLKAGNLKIGWKYFMAIHFMMMKDLSLK